MRGLFILLVVFMVVLTSCTGIQKKEKDCQPSSFQPEPLNDQWYHQLIGQWNVRIESDIMDTTETEDDTGGFTIEYDLNGQFLIMKGHTQTTEITAEQIQYLKDTSNASDEDIERLQRHAFKELQIHTIDPRTGERIGYLFDSMRCIATGTGRLEGNKEIMEWVWSAQAQGATSVCIIEKIDKNKFSLYHKYILPNGNIMEDKAIMTRKKIKTEK